jgi:hypothetical protein
MEKFVLWWLVVETVIAIQAIAITWLIVKGQKPK